MCCVSRVSHNCLGMLNMKRCSACKSEIWMNPSNQSIVLDVCAHIYLLIITMTLCTLLRKDGVV